MRPSAERPTPKAFASKRPPMRPRSRHGGQAGRQRARGLWLLRLVWILPDIGELRERSAIGGPAWVEGEGVAVKRPMGATKKGKR